MPIGYFGHFELIKELGRGDMGIVYEAREHADLKSEHILIDKSGEPYLIDARTAILLGHRSGQRSWELSGW